MPTKTFYTTLLKTALFQLLIATIFFLGMLLDPIVGLWIVVIYFSVIGTFFIYKYFERK